MRTEYLEKAPNWQTSDSAWKAGQVLRMLERHHIVPKTVCEVGCGAGEVLKQLQDHLDADCRYRGYEISPSAYQLCQARANERLEFRLGQIADDPDVFFDLVLVLDVIEHIEDYFSFLRDIRPKGRYKLCHVPLDIHMAHLLFSRHPFLRSRDVVGHIHYFTLDLALRVLSDSGYRILDHFYTYCPPRLIWRELPRQVISLVRKAAFGIHQDFAVRALGGFSLLVLAE